ncbi:cell wall-binding repeat-containing protein [Peptostreptococcus faecalis]|uniref:cell wall-binding repeat-containing protein n=1 Tax=Peptostreptococcus faecalis TaxID=2045015 RepID=UPI000C7A7846|nr:cell wall-binding repeat-containing protein [Peptostreptococcus faecalis]
MNNKIKKLFFGIIFSMLIFVLASNNTTLANSDIEVKNNSNSIKSEFLIKDEQLRKIINTKLKQPINYNATAEELASIKGIFNLQGKSEDFIKFETLDGIQYLKNVTTLQIGYVMFPEESFKYLGELTELNTLTINGSYITGNDATTVRWKMKINGENYKERQEINIDNDISLEPLKNLTNLTTFKFDYVNTQQNGSYSFSNRTKIDLAAIGNFKKLNRLDLGNFGESYDPSYSWLENLTNLTYLTISSTDFDDLKSVSKLDKLKTFIFTDDYVNDLRPVAEKSVWATSGLKYVSKPKVVKVDENGRKYVKFSGEIFLGSETKPEIRMSSEMAKYFAPKSLDITNGALDIEFYLNDEPPTLKLYNYLTGNSDKEVIGLSFGLKTTLNGKNIDYTSIVVPIKEHADEYSVIYNGNGNTSGTVPVDPNKYIEESDVTILDKNTLEKDGHKFIGWNTEADGSGTKYNVGSEFKILEDTTLYAMWEKEDTPGGGGGVGTVNPPAKKATAVLANGSKYTDVLTATVLANERNCPILLTGTDSISTETLNELKRRGTGDIIISGGVDSVSKKVEEQLKDFNIIRYAGNDRYETAKEIGKAIRSLTGKTEGAFLVDGTNFPDVITISSLAANKRLPILLTNPEKLTATTEKTIKDWNIKNITIGGQDNSVGNNIETKLKNEIKISTSRIGGSDRYETASLIGKEVRKSTGNTKDMILVDGTNFPDGITINSLAAKFKAPIHLTRPASLTDITANDISDWKIENIIVGGGENSVSKSIYDGLKVANKERISGADRYSTAVKISQKLDSVNFIK